MDSDLNIDKQIKGQVRHFQRTIKQILGVIWPCPMISHWQN